MTKSAPKASSKTFTLPRKQYIGRAIRARAARVPRRDEVHDEKTCAICLEPLQEGELCTVVKCGHPFHTSCERAWKAEKPHGGCAVCRDGAEQPEPQTDRQLFVAELLFEAHQPVGSTQFAIISDLVSINTNAYDENLAREAFEDTLAWVGGDVLSSMTGAILWRLMDAFLQEDATEIPHVIRGRLVGPSIAEAMVALVLETTYDRVRQQSLVVKEFYSRALKVKLGYLNAKQAQCRQARIVCMGIVAPPDANVPEFEDLFDCSMPRVDVSSESYATKKAISDLLTLALVASRNINRDLKSKIRRGVPNRVDDEVYDSPIVMAFAVEAVLADSNFFEVDDWLSKQIKGSLLFRRIEFCLAVLTPSISRDAPSRDPLLALVHGSVKKDRFFQRELARLSAL